MDNIRLDIAGNIHTMFEVKRFCYLSNSRFLINDIFLR